VIGFYIAEVDLEAGRYTNSIRVNPSNGARGYDYQPAFSPDGKHIIAKRLLTGDRFGSEIVLVEFDEVSYFETPLAPSSDKYCWLARCSAGGTWVSDHGSVNAGRRPVI
jgi:hypothetical protein